MWQPAQRSAIIVATSVGKLETPLFRVFSAFFVGTNAVVLGAKAKNNAINTADYKRAVREVRGLGIDPEDIPHRRP